MKRLSAIRYVSLLAVLVSSFLFLFPVLSRAEDPIRIGGTLALTGKYAAFADMQLKGFRLWEQDVNNRGGILGRPVEVIILDDESDAEHAVKLYEKLILHEQIDFLFAPFSSEITLHVLPLTERYGYPMLISGASSDLLWEQGHEHVFGLFLPASRITSGFLELLVMESIDGVAIVYSEDPFSRSVGEGARKWAGILGLQVKLFEPIGNGENTVYASLASKVVESKARVLMVCGFMDAFVGLRKALADDGRYDGIYYTPLGPGLPEFYTKLKDRAEGVFSTSQWQLHVNRDLPDSKAFVQSFIDAYGTEPSYFAATAFASGQLLEEAVRRAMATDRKKVRVVLSRMGAKSIIGRYGVDSKGVQIKNFSFVVQVQNGRPEVVWPTASATRPPVF